ncbi:MAG TPA: hypothetical protein ENK93_05630 [Campylobacteraceae bacterium]|nr:hypothetical protein [Campylobacteraceae bacterium]
MPITPLEGIIYANQNMQVPASKQTDYRNRVEFQNIVAAARVNEAPSLVQDVGDLTETEPVDPDKEHQREEAEEETGEKEEETQKRIERLEKIRKRAGEEELFDSLPYHILDIRV